MGSSPGRKKRVRMSLWIKLTRLINLFLGLVLALTAYLQIVRDHAVIWVPVFLVPAAVTFITVAKPQAAERLEVKAVVSLHIGSCLSLLVYVGTRLVKNMAHEKTIFLMFESTPGERNSYNPLHYKEGWEIMSVLMVVGWLKFLTMTTREHLRESGVSAVEVSPDRMLRTVFVMMAVAGVLMGFWHVDSLVPVASRIASLARTVHGVMNDPNPPIFSNVARPQGHEALRQSALGRAVESPSWRSTRWPETRRRLDKNEGARDSVGRPRQCDADQGAERLCARRPLTLSRGGRFLVVTTTVSNSLPFDQHASWTLLLVCLVHCVCRVDVVTPERASAEAVRVLMSAADAPLGPGRPRPQQASSSSRLQDPWVPRADGGASVASRSPSPSGTAAPRSVFFDTIATNRARRGDARQASASAHGDLGDVVLFLQGAEQTAGTRLDHSKSKAGKKHAQRHAQRRAEQNQELVQVEQQIQQLLQQQQAQQQKIQQDGARYQQLQKQYQQISAQLQKQTQVFQTLQQQYLDFNQRYRQKRRLTPQQQSQQLQWQQYYQYKISHQHQQVQQIGQQQAQTHQQLVQLYQQLQQEQQAQQQLQQHLQQQLQRQEQLQKQQEQQEQEQREQEQREQEQLQPPRRQSPRPTSPKADAGQPRAGTSFDGINDLLRNVLTAEDEDEEGDEEGEHVVDLVELLEEAEEEEEEEEEEEDEETQVDQEDLKNKVEECAAQIRSLSTDDLVSSDLEVVPRVRRASLCLSKGPSHLNVGPSLTHLGPSGVQKGPAHLNKGPGRLNKGPRYLSRGPSKLSRGPQDLNVGPARLNVGPSDFHFGPSDLHRGPSGVNRGPGVNKGPGHINKGPAGEYTGLPTPYKGLSSLAKGPSQKILGPASTRRSTEALH
ncbi:golgin subfamily A member 6-like protein 2 [Penaeus chinensis]|uniref:golgin subfamily A member 6-like protein 2 n=1 Tax=Penaeus chinensis TaxID=139456 RepID=UPI001FB7F6FB|nr:golgin subfamily A member 6-like protein 2 [Penaeus chinensis]